MKLRTEILPGQSDALITHKHRIYLCGSCFSENISQKLVHAGFHVLSNSHGIIYNPVSIARAMQDLFTGYKYGLSDLNQEEDRVFSYSHHGSFDSKNAMQVLQKINQIIHEHR